MSARFSLTAATSLACLLALLPLQAQSQNALSGWIVGTLTNYGGAQDGMDPYDPSYGTLDGACGYGLLSESTYPYWTVAALSPENQFYQAGPSGGCGQCFEVMCMNEGGPNAGRCGTPGASVTVTITDDCPQCDANHIDMQALTFNVLAPMAIGLIDMQYRRVDCQVPAPVNLNVDNNVGPGGWLRLVVEKVAGYGGITGVAMRTSGDGSWNSLANEWGSAWEMSNTPDLPWDFSFTSDSDQTIQVYGLISADGLVGSIPTDVQFSLSGASGGTTFSVSGGGPPPASPVSFSPPPAVVSTPPAVVPTPPAAVPTPPAAGPSAGCASCADVAPFSIGAFSCSQQAAFGQCGQSWMEGYCQLSCGLCSCDSAPTPPSPVAAAPTYTQSPPSSGGCVDVLPPDSPIDCSTQASYGQCGASWMTATASSAPYGYCAATCGRCPATSPPSPTYTAPPAPYNRRKLI